MILLYVMVQLRLCKKKREDTYRALAVRVSSDLKMRTVNATLIMMAVAMATAAEGKARQRRNTCSSNSWDTSSVCSIPGDRICCIEIVGRGSCTCPEGQYKSSCKVAVGSDYDYEYGYACECQGSDYDFGYTCEDGAALSRNATIGVVVGLIILLALFANTIAWCKTDTYGCAGFCWLCSIVQARVPACRQAATSAGDNDDVGCARECCENCCMLCSNGQARMPAATSTGNNDDDVELIIHPPVAADEEPASHSYYEDGNVDEEPASHSYYEDDNAG